MFGLSLGLFLSSVALCVSLLEGSKASAKGKRIVILLGPPGSGKGTQAVKLAQELSLPHISTGDLFRENIRNATELGKRACFYTDAGKLVPDALVLDMLFDRVARPDCDEGFLLDGFPRTIPQAQAFDDKLSTQDSLIVLNLMVSNELIVRRIEGRLSCKACGNVHNKYFSPPLVAGICDHCGGELFQRADDRAEVVQERLRVYEEQTAPLIDYYAKKQVLFNCDGERPPEAVLDDLLGKIRTGPTTS